MPFDLRTTETCDALPRLRLMGVDLVDATTSEVISAMLDTGRPCRVAFYNAHCSNVAATDPVYADALATANMILPDGIGVELGARFAGKRLTENLNGTDFCPAFLAEAARRGLSVYLLGGQPGVAETAARNLVAKIPGLRIAGARDGYEGMHNQGAVRAEINRSGADIVLVALGVPMQDVWLAQNAALLNARYTFGVGALLDFLAGRVTRAPKIVRAARCEWVWRLAMEPRRMAKRYLTGNPLFLARAARAALVEVDGESVMRRALDVTVSAAALVALSPILIGAALAIRLESGGPILFRQTRIGRDGRPFTMFKFRSMHIQAEAMRARIEEASDRDGICFKARKDPRVTRVGRILRRYSIDELPQIFNVLRGEMSVVGPRPALPQEVAAYPAHALKRLAVKPGLTGIWQVSGRADIGFDKMIDMDVAYVRSRSLWLDVMLLALTARAVLAGRGAY